MFAYFLKKTLRNRSFVFWTVIFPIALMSCFKVAFSNIYSSTSEFDSVDAIYVCEDSISVNELITEFVNDNNLDELFNSFIEDVEMAEIKKLWETGNYELIQSKFDDGTFSEDEISEKINSIIEEYKAKSAVSSDSFLENIVISDELSEKLDTFSYGLIFRMIADGSDCFNLSTKDNLQEARLSLKNGDAKMILIVKDKDVRIELSEEYSEMDANIATSFLATYKTEYQVMREMLFTTDLEELFNADNGEEIGDKLNESFGNDFSMKEITKEKPDIYDETPDPFNWYYYSTIVMGIMFNIITGIGIVADAQADVSTGAMRISLSSSKKSSLVISMFFARFVMCFVITFIQIMVANLAFGIPIGKRFFELLVFDAAANFFALSVGLICGLFFKGKVSERENKANALLMTSVFISGEMINVLPAVIQQNAPFINEINPATVLNFTFYKLVYYGNLTSFYINIVKIVLVSILCIAISIMRMRRQKYASI